MLPEILGLLLFLASGGSAPGREDARYDAFARALGSLRRAAVAALPAKAAFRPAERAVTNWRIEAAGNLDLSPETSAKLLAGADPPGVARCVRLNNYWCVKRAGWAGEIAADAEGHVAFASALEGAVVAAMLLRRYYLVHQRRTAQAILSRWAPARCGVQMAGAGRLAAPSKAMILRRQRALAPRGIGNTLRARWLAAHGRGFGGPTGKAIPRRSVVADRPIPLMRTPEIAVGMGERDLGGAPLRLAALEPALDLGLPTPLGPTCLDETQRIHNYALRAIEGVAASPDEDLKLFSSDGTPGPNLPQVLANMARVEIGPWSARAELVAAAVEIEARRSRDPATLAGKTPPEP